MLEKYWQFFTEYDTYEEKYEFITFSQALNSCHPPNKDNSYGCSYFEGYKQYFEIYKQIF